MWDKLSPFLIDMITQQNSQSESVCVLTAGIVLKEQKYTFLKRGESGNRKLSKNEKCF